MTIEEALEQVGETEHYFVVWRFDSGRILGVFPLGIVPDKTLKAEWRERLKEKNPILKGRFFRKKHLTRLALEKLTHETAENEARQRHRQEAYSNIRKHWATLPAEQLIEKLETPSYEWPMANGSGEEYLIDLLFRSRYDQLVGSLRERLIAIAVREPPFAEIKDRKWAERMNFELQVRVAALSRDTGTLFKLWQENHTLISWNNLMTLLQCYAQTGGKEPAIIEQLTGIIARSEPLAPLIDAMLCLGQIGPAAGSRAIEVIRAVIYDSSPLTTALRERVCERIATPNDAWTTCAHCRNDPPLALGVGNYSHVCPVCLGLAVVPK